MKRRSPYKAKHTFANRVGTSASPVPNGDALQKAAGLGNLNFMAELLKEDPNRVSGKDDHGDTPLHWAAANGQKGAANLLLANNADANARNGAGATPLHKAATSGHIELVEALLAHGAKLAVNDQYGYTPVQSAHLCGQVGIVQFLLSKGAEDPSNLASLKTRSQREAEDEEEGKGKGTNTLIFTLLLIVPAISLVNWLAMLANTNDSYEMSRALDIGNPSLLGILGWIFLILAFANRPWK